MNIVIGAPVKSDYNQAKELLGRHRRMSVGAAIEHSGPIGDAIGELAFAGKTDWAYVEVLQRIGQLRTFTMSVGQWLGRHHPDHP